MAMLSFVSSSIATVVTFLAFIVLTPTLAAYVIRFSFRGLGYLIRRRTKWRRELLRTRISWEEDNYRSQETRQAASPRTVKADDEDDWEKVDSYGGNSDSSSPKSKPSSAEQCDWDGIVGFFHPFCNAGGGGERVLWAAVESVQKRWPKAICAIYTGDHDVDKLTMLQNIERRFNIKLYSPTVVFLYLSTRKYVVSSTYPRLTLLAQSLGSLVVAYDAFNLLVPDIFIDTMGYAFALAFSHYLFPSVPTGAYVHYPTISTDMLDSLNDTSGSKGLNSGAGKGWKGVAKKHYWRAFSKLYGWAGGTIDVVMCNSSWTSAHIKALWLSSRRGKKQQFQTPTVVFPPVAVSELEPIKVDLESERKTRQPSIIYIAQFRPEKNHALILQSFARFLKQHNQNTAAQTDTNPSSSSNPTPKLILIGSVRHNSGDETHIYNLRLLAHELRIRDHLTFLCDANWPTVLDNLRHASIGVNAMWNEHFGIGVVEYQAAGVISVVHDSGGPKQDIVTDLDGEGATGFHATTETEYAAAFETVLALPEAERYAMRLRARKSARRFSGEEFSRRWLGEMEKLVMLQKQWC